MALSTEDTIIEARPRGAGNLFAPFADGADGTSSGSLLERCRTLFRQLGERMSSFDISRQIYG